MKKIKKIILYFILIFILILFFLLNRPCNNNIENTCKDIKKGYISFKENFNYSEWLKDCTYSKSACESLKKHMLYYNEICYDGNETQKKLINELYNKAMKNLYIKAK